MEKLADAKITKAATDCLIAIAEVCTLQFVLAQSTRAHPFPSAPTLLP